MSVHWFKSSFSGSEKTCVEIAHRRDAVLIRDSKYHGPRDAQPIVSVRPEDWTTFLALALNMDSGVVSDALAISVHEDGGATVTGAGVALVYNRDEWVAFAKGVAAGEFARS